MCNTCIVCLGNFRNDRKPDNTKLYQLLQGCNNWYKVLPDTNTSERNIKKKNKKNTKTCTKTFFFFFLQNRKKGDVI